MQPPQCINACNPTQQAFKNMAPSQHNTTCWWACTQKCLTLHCTKCLVITFAISHRHFSMPPRRAQTTMGYNKSIVVVMILIHHCTHFNSPEMRTTQIFVDTLITLVKQHCKPAHHTTNTLQSTPHRQTNPAQNIIMRLQTTNGMSVVWCMFIPAQ